MNPDIYGMYQVVLAVYRRYNYLLQTSLAAEFIEGFDGYTLEDVFGEGYQECAGPRNLSKTSFFSQLGNTPGRTNGFEGSANMFAYFLALILWHDSRADKEEMAVRINSLIMELFDCMERQDPIEGVAWLHVIMKNNGVEHYVESE